MKALPGIFTILFFSGVLSFWLWVSSRDPYIVWCKISCRRLLQSDRSKCSRVMNQHTIWYIYMSTVYHTDVWYVCKLSLIAQQHVVLTVNRDNCSILYSTWHDLHHTVPYNRLMHINSEMAHSWISYHIIGRPCMQEFYTQYFNMYRIISKVPNQHCTFQWQI